MTKDQGIPIDSEGSGQGSDVSASHSETGEADVVTIRIPLLLAAKLRLFEQLHDAGFRIDPITLARPQPLPTHVCPECGHRYHGVDELTSGALCACRDSGGNDCTGKPVAIDALNAAAPELLCLLLQAVDALGVKHSGGQRDAHDVIQDRLKELGLYDEPWTR